MTVLAARYYIEAHPTSCKMTGSGSFGSQTVLFRLASRASESLIVLRHCLALVAGVFQSVNFLSGVRGLSPGDSLSMKYIANRRL